MAIKPSYMESKYFTAEQEVRRDEIRERLGKVTKKLDEQQAIARTLGTDDKSLVERIQSLGFTGDSARVFDILPLILVSWADGTVQRKERATILAILESRDIKPGSEASLFIETLLELPPSDSFMKVALELLRDLAKAKGDMGGSVVDMCVRVADASGGLLGVGSRVSAEERELIQSIADMLGDGAIAQFKKSLG